MFLNKLGSAKVIQIGVIICIVEPEVKVHVEEPVIQFFDYSIADVIGAVDVKGQSLPQRTAVIVNRLELLLKLANV